MGNDPKKAMGELKTKQDAKKLLNYPVDLQFDHKTFFLRTLD